MTTAQDFEDALQESLTEMVGDRGVAMRRRQEFRMRAGKFAADQHIDFMVDSPHDEFYIGVEAKTAKASSARGWYFSNYYPAEQVEKQVEYGERSGREIFVAAEIRDFEGDDYWLLFPVEYFHRYVAAGEKRVDWDELVEDGVSWAGGVTEAVLDEARAMREELEPAATA